MAVSTDIKLCGQCGKPDNHPVCCLTPALAPSSDQWFFEVQHKVNPENQDLEIIVSRRTYPSAAEPKKEFIGSVVLSELSYGIMSQQQKTDLHSEYVNHIIKQWEAKQLTDLPKPVDNPYIAQQQQVDNSFGLSSLLGGSAGLGVSATASNQQVPDNPFEKEEKALSEALYKGNYPVVKYLEAELAAKKQSFAASQVLNSQKPGTMTAAGIKHMAASLWGKNVAPMKGANYLVTVHPDAVEQLASPQEATASYYNKKFVENLKANTSMASFSKGTGAPAEIADGTEEGFANTVDPQQKFLTRIGMMSNGNVTLQGKQYGYPRRFKYRLFCEVCMGATELGVMDVESRNHQAADLVSFTKDHRHLADAPTASEGRRFRDSD